MFLWNLIKGFLPSTGWLGYAFLAGGLLLGLSASAHWLREDAFNDCNAGWQLKVAKENEAILLKAAVQGKKIWELETKLLSLADKATAMEAENAKLLKDQRDAVPQTDDCKRCRVPSARIWVRPSPARSSVTN